MATYYDLVIIGAGPGGYTAALKGASFGMKVAVVDENKLGRRLHQPGMHPHQGAAARIQHFFHDAARG